MPSAAPHGSHALASVAPPSRLLLVHPLSSAAQVKIICTPECLCAVLPHRIHLNVYKERQKVKAVSNRERCYTQCACGRTQQQVRYKRRRSSIHHTGKPHSRLQERLHTTTHPSLLTKCCTKRFPAKRDTACDLYVLLPRHLHDRNHTHGRGDQASLYPQAPCAVAAGVRHGGGLSRTSRR